MTQHRAMRSKEEANDYRYFPDPDLLPVQLEENLLQELQQNLPELPDVKKARFYSEYGLSTNDAEQLSASRDMADYFEHVVAGKNDQAKMAANWVLGELSAGLNQSNLDIDS